MVVLEDHVVVAPVDEDLVAVDLHDMEGAAVGHELLELHLLKLGVDLEQRVVELIPGLALVGAPVPPKM